jgi:hypothetical protein
MRCSFAAVFGLLAWSSGEAQAPRRWLPVSVEEIGRYQDAQGRFLLNPRTITACGSHVVVADYGSPALVSFGMDGMPRWKYDHHGAGPSEFRGINDVSCDRTGRVWNLDIANGRILILDSTGTRAETITLPQQGRRLAVSGDGSVFFLAPQSVGELVSAFAAVNAKLLRTTAAPEPIRSLGRLQREGNVVMTTDSVLVMSFRWASLLVGVGPDGTIRYRTEGVEYIPFPEERTYPIGTTGNKAIRIAPGATEAVRHLFPCGTDLVCVLFRGASERADHVVDQYVASNGTYRGSINFPVAPLSLVIVDTLAFALLSDPFPTLIRYRIRR